MSEHLPDCICLNACGGWSPDVLTNGLVQEVWEGEQPECVPGGGSVKHDVLEVGVLRALQELHYFADGHCFVYARGQRV